ncbi:RNA polymerase sigma factor [Streptomyces xylophagus]|uniref:RNA polymerase sigma factor n=1 Tax=Streptomyces xylophagus TaxID=285514 RepID=UPI0009968932|nr:sigma-70 family RNA polymerase sigma factor [Streptomyces xylophagus]
MAEQVYRDGKWVWQDVGGGELGAQAQQPERDEEPAAYFASAGDEVRQFQWDLEPLYVENRPKMVNYARKLLWSQGIPESRLPAEDVVQDAWVVAAMKRSEIYSPVAYVYGVIRGRVLLEARRKMIMEAQDPGQIDELPSWSSGDDDLTLAMRSYLQRLSMEQRTAVFRSFMLGESHAEIAWHLGVSKGTVASRIYRARAVLAACLTALLALVAWIVLSQRDVGSDRGPCQGWCPPGPPVSPPVTAPSPLPFDPGAAVSDIQWSAFGLALVVVLSVWGWTRLRRRRRSGR